VTSVCPTLISCSPYDYGKLIRLFPKTSGKKTKAASMLGLHLEGPYFGLEKIGAHPLNNVKTPKNHPISKVYGDDLKNVKIVTLAPEVDGSLDLIKELKTKHPSIVVSIGHSSANLKEAQMSVRAGATKITHLFNAMRSFHHRDPGIVGLLGCAELNENLYYGIICDGFHCHPSCVQMAYQSHPTGACLVTDAMSALGLPKGRHTLGDSVVEVVDADLDGLKGIKAVLADSNTLAGAIVTMDECVRNFHRFAKCSIAEALDAATINPARCLGISDHKGKLAYGFDGDIVILE
jgi:N-acetylglucosamine-6-phosphate deacetylase